MAQSSHDISALELLAVYAGLVIWKGRLEYRKAFVAIDNEAARCSLIKSSSAAPCLRALCGLVAAHDLKHPSFRWYVRVPSKSNSSDDPSRHELRRLRRLGAVRRRLKWEDLNLEQLAWI